MTSQVTWRQLTAADKEDKLAKSRRTLISNYPRRCEFACEEFHCDVSMRDDGWTPAGNDNVLPL